MHHQDRERIAGARRLGVAGGEDAAAGGHQMRGEQHAGARHHFHFRRMTVVEQAVGAEIAIDRAEMGAGIGAPARATGARGGVDDDSLLLDRARVEQRAER